MKNTALVFVSCVALAGCVGGATLETVSLSNGHKMDVVSHDGDMYVTRDRVIYAPNGVMLGVVSDGQAHPAVGLIATAIGGGSFIAGQAVRRPDQWSIATGGASADGGAGGSAASHAIGGAGGAGGTGGVGLGGEAVVKGGAGGIHPGGTQNVTQNVNQHGGGPKTVIGTATQ